MKYKLKRDKKGSIMINDKSFSVLDDKWKDFATKIIKLKEGDEIKIIIKYDEELKNMRKRDKRLKKYFNNKQH